LNADFRKKCVGQQNTKLNPKQLSLRMKWSNLLHDKREIASQKDARDDIFQGATDEYMIFAEKRSFFLKKCL
jgi:hypothetical protein